MKYRKFIIPCLLLSFLFLFSTDPTSSEIPISKSNVHSNPGTYLDSIKAVIDGIDDRKQYDNLPILASTFQLDPATIPDSLKIRFRSVCMWFGFLFKKELGDYRTSLTYYLKAFEAAGSPHLDSLSWFIENEIASIYTRFGDYDKSEYFHQYVEASLKYYQKPALLSRLYTNMGTNQQSSGKNESAIFYFKRGLAIADSLKYPTGIFSNSLGLAQIYLEMNDDSVASHYLERAKSIIDLLKQDSHYYEKKSALEATTGQYYGRHHQNGNSINSYLVAIQSLGQYYPSKQHREFCKLYVEIAKAYVYTDDQDSAEYYLNLGLHSLIPDCKEPLWNLDPALIYKENSFIDLLEVEYDLLNKKYKSSRDTTYLGHAFHCVQSGLYANDQLRGDLVLDPSKLASIRYNKRLTNTGIETLYELMSIRPSPVYLNRVREMMTRSKSMLYNEKIRIQAIALQMTTADKMKRDSLEEKILKVIDKKFDADADYASINQQYITLQEEVQSINSRYSDIKRPVIRHDDYIEFEQTDSAIYVLVHWRASLKFLKLGSKFEFQKLLDRMNQYIALKELSDDQEICHDLYQFFIAPLHLALPGKMVIIPDGQISQVPFELLQDEHGEYLLKRTIISYEYQYEPFLLDEKAKEKPDLVFCLAPAYSISSPASAAPSRGEVFKLPFAKTEVEKIRSILGKKVFIAEDGNKEKCMAELKKARIFHFSGHAIVKPEMAYLALTDKMEHGQQLTDREIDLMSNPMDMVVLSACETGLGKWEYGEGIRSLGRSFMEAGAGAAIYSLWNVNDRSTATIMGSFYTHLKQGCRKDEALRKAKLDFLVQAQGPYTHPFHWAAFIAAGDMRPLQHQFPDWMLISGAILVLSLAIWKLKPHSH